MSTGSGTPAAAPTAAACLQESCRCMRVGSIDDAIAGFERAIALAEAEQQPAVLAEALRGLAILRHQRDDAALARELRLRSKDHARSVGNDVLEPDALNTVEALDMSAGLLAHARAH